MAGLHRRVGTVAVVSLFFAGLKHVGPTTASVLATVEPLVTVLLAFVVFGERLSGAQLAGGAVMLGGVLVLNARLRRRRRIGDAVYDLRDHDQGARR